jgi:hypothetical protein
MVVLLIGISLMLYVHPKLTAIDEQTDDEIVHLGGLREADRLAHQALDPWGVHQKSGDSPLLDGQFYDGG